MDDTKSRILVSVCEHCMGDTVLLTQARLVMFAFMDII